MQYPPKDARSVSLYPYNRSQICQYVKNTKSVNIEKEMANFLTNKVFLNKKLKHNNNNTKKNIKPLAGAGN